MFSFECEYIAVKILSSNALVMEPTPFRDVSTNSIDSSEEIPRIE
jgi:hypothetical protein